MKATKDTLSVDAYIQSFPKAVKSRLKEIRTIVRLLAPKATEKISYQMPAFFLHGNLVYFGAFEHHIGLYPGVSGVAAFQDEIKSFKSAKGSIQFPHDKPLPVALIRKIMKYKVQENLQRMKKKE